MPALLGLAAASLAAWIGLLVGRGLFWWPSPRLEPRSGDSRADVRSVIAVVPARNEAPILPKTLPTVLTQEYPGPFRVVVVDDQSEDETSWAARVAAEGVASEERLEIVPGKPLPDGWSGKVWAMEQGLAVAGDAELLWFTDADIAHEPWVLRALVAKAETDELDLVSTMARLRVDSAWERLLVPAFVYFFAKLFPFRFVSDSRRRNAGAAGGCILVRQTAVERAGGLAAIRSALIDDCALGRFVKRTGGRIWLGFCDGVRSVRSYGSLGGIWNMVARSAYTQLGHSPLMLLGTFVGMLFLYALPTIACLGGAIGLMLGWTTALSLFAAGGSAWVLMAASFVPLLRHHGVSWAVAPLLPVAGALYTAMTVSSAWRHWSGRGGAWKGRTY